MHPFIMHISTDISLNRCLGVSIQHSVQVLIIVIRIVVRHQYKHRLSTSLENSEVQITKHVVHESVELVGYVGAVVLSAYYKPSWAIPVIEFLFDEGRHFA